MYKLDTTRMDASHPRFIEFLNKLEAVLETEDCDGMSLALSFKVLRHMGFTYEAIAASFKGFEDEGGFCDCEVLINVARP